MALNLNLVTSSWHPPFERRINLLKLLQKIMIGIFLHETNRIGYEMPNLSVWCDLRPREKARILSSGKAINLNSHSNNQKFCHRTLYKGIWSMERVTPPHNFFICISVEIQDVSPPVEAAKRAAVSHFPLGRDWKYFVNKFRSRFPTCSCR